MDIKTKDKFIRLWKKYFDGVPLPIAFYYTNEIGSTPIEKSLSGHWCIIANLSQVRKGKSLVFDADSIGCSGGKRYLGFAKDIRPNFEYFLSCGIPGKLEGERYKKSPQLVKQAMEKMPEFTAPARFIVFKRWDMLEESEEPNVVIFFAQPDVLSGLFTLANFDEVEPDGIFGTICSGMWLYCSVSLSRKGLTPTQKRSRAV